MKMKSQRSRLMYMETKSQKSKSMHMERSKLTHMETKSQISKSMQGY